MRAAHYLRFERRTYIEPDEKPSPPPDLDKRRMKFIFDDIREFKPARLDDLKGLPHVARELKRYISFLKNIDEFRSREVRTQPGVLFYGDPGTGKTLSARIIATESNARLINVTEFPRAGNGWTAEDIGSLFKLAREYRAFSDLPVILYFDEIDSICPSEVPYKLEATVALMGELDGLMGKPEGILVIASTNDMDDVDDGVLRAGRIGHHIFFPKPDEAGLADIIRHYVSKKPHDEIDFEGLARVLEGRTGAEVEELVERAYLNACLDLTEPRLTETDLVRLVIRDMDFGESAMWNGDEERYRACVHEAGHVVIGVTLELPVVMTAVPEERGSGATFMRPLKPPLTREDIENRIVAMFGGEIAERMILGTGSIGSENDVGKATTTSVRLIAELGEKTNYLEELGLLSDPSPLHPVSEEERARIYREAMELRERCHARAIKILEEYGKEALEKVARVIEEREFLLAEDMVRVVRESADGKLTIGPAEKNGAPACPTTRPTEASSRSG